MNKLENHELQAAEEKQELVKKSYCAPQIIEYGSVTKLTKNNTTGSFTDNGGQRMVGSCL